VADIDVLNASNPIARLHNLLPSLRNLSCSKSFMRQPFSSYEHAPESNILSALHADFKSFDNLPAVHMRLDRRISEAYAVQAKKVFAVVEVGGTQYKVTPDDLITTEKLEGVDINDTLRLQRVLMLGSVKETVIGRPYIQGASVVAAVEEQFLDGKVISFYKRRRKNSRRTRGHRQPLTTLRILEVVGIDEAAEHSLDGSTIPEKASTTPL